MKILNACDGSTSADDAVNDLTRAGLPRQADTLIVHVQEKWLPPPSSYEIVEEVLVSSNFAAARRARALQIIQLPLQDNDL